MNFTSSSNRSHCHLVSLILVLFCICGTTVAQTFQYSRGWANGKKRSSIGPFLIQDMSESNEIFGVCQMQRLKQIWENRQLNRDYLPCEIIEKPQVEIVDKFRRKGDCNRNSILDSLPPHQN